MTDNIKAGIYCRISLAILDDTTKVADQERICRDLARRLGWHVADDDVFTDNNRSAWKHTRKRPGWDKMLQAVSAGKITAIIVYHGDRLVRQPLDLEVLLGLARNKGIKLASPSGVRDLDSDDDQFILGIEANMARRESANISRRKKAGFERMRRQGLTRRGGAGGRCFGFEPDGITHRPAEADIIRDASAAILAGRSVRAVASELAGRGVRSTAGKVMTPATFRRMLLWPRLAGLMPDGTSRAAWEPVLGRGEWEELRAVLKANTAHDRAGRGALHLLSGIAECGACGHPLYCGRNAGGPVYKCPQPGCHKVARSLGHIDAYVTGRVVGRLADPALRAAVVPANPALAAELLSLTERRAEAEAVIAGYADRPERLAILARALDSIDARIGEVRDLVAATGQERLLGAHAGASREGFEALPLDTRRALVRACYRVVVLPAARRGPGFDSASVQMTPV